MFHAILCVVLGSLTASLASRKERRPRSDVFCGNSHGDNGHSAKKHSEEQVLQSTRIDGSLFSVYCYCSPPTLQK